VITVLVAACYILYSDYSIGCCLLHFVQWLLYWLLPVIFCTVVTLFVTACYICLTSVLNKVSGLT